MKILKYPLIVILVLLAVFFAIGIVDPSIEYESEVEVNAPVETAWAVFTNIDNMDQWMTGLKQVRVVEGSAGVIGSKLEFIFEQRGEEMKVYETLTSYEKASLYEFDIDSEVLESHTKIDFIKINDQTCRIKSTTEVEAKGMLWKSVFVLIRNTFIDQSNLQYEKLKTLIEEKN